MKYKILNLYACLGGNRLKWDEVAKEAGIEIEVTAVCRLHIRPFLHTMSAVFALSYFQ